MCTPPAQFGLSTRHPPRWPVHQPPLQSSRLPYHLIVNDPGLELEEKVFVFRIIFRGLDALARKGANTRHALPERQSREVGDLAVPALKDVDADVPRNRAIVGDGALLQKLSVVLSLSARNASVPHTTIIGSSSRQQVRRIGCAVGASPGAQQNRARILAATTSDSSSRKKCFARFSSTTSMSQNVARKRGSICLARNPMSRIG